MDDNLHGYKNTIPVSEIAKNFIDFINHSSESKNKEILKIPAITLFTDIEEIIKNNPNLTSIAIFEILEEKYSTAIASKDIELLRSIVPKKHTKSNNKLANRIAKDIVDEGKIDLIVTEKNAKKEVTTKVMLNYDDEYVHISRGKFSAYDREVYDGVTTLYGAGNEIITPPMVYRAMNGLTEAEQISDKAVDEVRKSLDKSRYIKTVIDYTDEAKLYNKSVEKTVYEGYLLAAEKITIKISGNEQEAYKLLRSPILYEYAQISGQILNVPINLLNTRDTVNSTEEVIVIRGYLLRQIEWMKNEKSKRSTNITYQGVYEELSVFKMDLDDKSYKEKTFKIRSHVKSILESWQTQSYITGFKEYKDGRQIKGVKIHL